MFAPVNGYNTSIGWRGWLSGMELEYYAYLAIQIRLGLFPSCITDRRQLEPTSSGVIHDYHIALVRTGALQLSRTNDVAFTVLPLTHIWVIGSFLRLLPHIFLSQLQKLSLDVKCSSIR